MPSNWKVFTYKAFIYLVVATTLSACGGGSSSNSAEPIDTNVFQTKLALGENLFFDENLSFNRTQSCSTCHNPDRAFVDDRTDNNGETLATSLGDNEFSLGDRNAPTLAYAAEAPSFQYGMHTRFNSDQNDYVGYLGGQFSDGRSINLQAQAREPMLSDIEMGMLEPEAVIERVLENPDYEAAFITLFGDTIFDDTELAFDAVTESIAEFEKSPEFSSFDSKYDRSLTGDYILNPLSKAASGQAFFFSPDKTNCATCHQLNANNDRSETFTSYEYHNIGIPVNTDTRSENGVDANFVDEGLGANANITTDASSEIGKHKVPTLRNIALTAPYMHNGIFKELGTVLKFYDHYLAGSTNTINPETGLAWGDAEVADTIAFTELEEGELRSDEEIEDLICFLRMLTDERYEHLINDDLDCGL